MKQTKQFLRPLLMAIVMMVGMLMPQGAWAQELEVWEEEPISISSDASYDEIVVQPGGVLIINEGVTLTVTSSLYINENNINGFGTVINYGTIIGEGCINMMGGVLANHGHIDLSDGFGYGTFYNTGTLGDGYFNLTPTECYHDDSENLGTVEATCTHGAGTQVKCNTCYYIGIKETGEPLPHDNHNHNGLMVCSNCGHTTFDATPVGEGTAESPYQIANAGHLFWFADKVNNDYENFKDANAVLTADIVVNDGTFADDGTFTATGASGTSTPIEWLIIGRFDLSSYGYRGTFDGQGHTISGLYANYTNSGLVGMSSGESKIKNVGVINSYFAGSMVGGICGRAFYNTEISNCYSSNVICKGAYVGGIVGLQALSDISIINCYSTASLIGVEDWAQVGGIAGGISGSTTNCYTTYGNATDWSESEINCEANVSLERFASGEIAYKLNGSVDGEGNWTAGATDGTQKWYQKLGEDGDSYPVLAAAEGNTVYAGYESCASENLSYSNANTLYATKEEAHVWEDGKCTVCKTDCEHDWEEYGEYVHKCNICELETDHDWSNGDSKCTACGYVCEHKTGNYEDEHTHHCYACDLSVPHIIDEDEEHLYYSVYTEDDNCVDISPGAGRNEISVKNYDELESLKFKVYSLCNVCSDGHTYNKVYAEDFFVKANYNDIDCSESASLDVCIYKRVDDGADAVVCHELKVSISNPSHKWENGVCSRCHAECEHDFTSKALTAEPDEHGLYAYVCDHGCGAHGDYNVVKGNGEGNNIELIATTDSETGITTYSAESVIIEDGKPFYSPVEFTTTDVDMGRQFTQSIGDAVVPATIVLPFRMYAGEVSTVNPQGVRTGTKFYSFTSLDYNSANDRWEANMDIVIDDLEAYTPYMVVLTDGEEIPFGNAPVTFTQTPAELNNTQQGDWTFVATNEEKVWKEDDFANGEVYYGFAAGNETTPEGKFVKVGAGASIDPLRAYIMKTPQTRAAGTLPSIISVRLNETSATGIGTLNTETGEFTFDGWYDLQGRRINEPLKNGISIKNGRKMMKK